LASSRRLAQGDSAFDAQTSLALTLVSPQRSGPHWMTGTLPSQIQVTSVAPAKATLWALSVGRYHVAGEPVAVIRQLSEF